MMTSAAYSASRAASFADLDRRAREGGALNVVFLGGSLTWGANASDPQRTSYRALMADWLRSRYPKASFAFYDAAIGGTGSKFGQFRLDHDVFSRNPDLVFLDFTVNDDATYVDPNTLASYEGILRRMISRGIPVEQMLLCFRDHVGVKPDQLAWPRYKAHMQLSEAYGTAVGDAMKRVNDAIAAGQADKATLWPWEGAHPDDPGYVLFFEAARDGFLKAVAEGRVCEVPQTPVFSDKYSNARRLLLVNEQLPAGWTKAKTLRTGAWFDGQSSRWMDEVVVCRAGGAVEPLKVDFDGTMVALLGERNGKGPKFKVKIDGQPVKNSKHEEVWSHDTSAFGGGNLFSWIELSDQLSPGRHTLEIEPVLDQAGAELRIESVCSAGIE